MQRAVLLCLLSLLALPGPALAGAPDPFLGIFAQDADYLPERALTTAVGQVNAGIGTVRADFDWRLIEPSRGAYDWTLPDRIVRAAATVGLAVQPTLYGSPAWATGVAADPFFAGVHPPKDPADFARHAGEMVRRYGPGGSFWRTHPQIPARPIRAWQIWNEPNLEAFWRGGPNPFAYAVLLRATSVAIRAADPGAEVILAGLPDSLGGIPPHDYLAAIYMAGAADTFDTIAVHPYGADQFAVMAVLNRLRRVADGYGDTDADMRVTEFGWASAGEESVLTVGEAGQAYLIAESIIAMRRAAAHLRLRGIVYFKWRDHPRPAGAFDIWPYFAGVLHEDGRPKPALRALRLGMAVPLEAAATATAKETTRAGSPTKPGADPDLLLVTLNARRTQSRREVQRRGLTLQVRCSTACTAAVRLTVGRPSGKRLIRRTAASRTLTFRGGRLTQVRVRLPRADLREVAAGRLRLWADAAGMDAAGGADQAMSVRVRLR